MVTTYYTKIALELYEIIDPDLFTEEFSILYRLDQPIEDSLGFDGGVVTVKIADEGAGPEFQDRLVEPVLERQETPAGPVIRVIDRIIVG